MAAEVRQQHRGDDDEPTHGGGAPLHVVRGRAVVADELAVALPHQDQDGQLGAEQRRDQGEAAGKDDRLHPGSSSGRGPTAERMSSATVSKAKPRDALTRTTSRGPRPAVSTATAAGLSATATAEVAGKPASTAASVMRFACSPRATSRSTPSRAANRPIARCSS